MLCILALFADTNKCNCTCLHQTHMVSGTSNERPTWQDTSSLLEPCFLEPLLSHFHVNHPMTKGCTSIIWTTFAGFLWCSYTRGSTVSATGPYVEESDCSPVLVRFSFLWREYICFGGEMSCICEGFKKKEKILLLGQPHSILEGWPNVCSIFVSEQWHACQCPDF